MVTTIELAAAQILGCDVDDVVKEKYDIYGLDVFSGNGMEYAVGTDEQATEAAKNYIKDSAWSFRPEYIASHTRAGASNGMIKAIRALQESCEGCNDDVLSLIEDLEEFMEDIISADGRGTLLSSYDSEEQEIVISGEMFFAYRLN